MSSSPVILQNLFKERQLSPPSPTGWTPNPCKSSRWDLPLLKFFFLKEKLGNFYEWNSFSVQKKGKRTENFPSHPPPVTDASCISNEPIVYASGTSVLMHFLGSLSDWGRNWSFECVMNFGQNGKSVYLFVFFRKNRLRAFTCKMAGKFE